MDSSDMSSGSRAGPSSRTLTSIEDRDEITVTSDRPITPMNSQWVSFTPQPNCNWRDKLTVDNKWKVEQELAQRMSQMDEPSRIVPVAKWMFTILLALAITVLFIATKVSFISLSLALNATRPISGPTEENMDIWVAHTGQFLVIYLVIAVPYFLLFLRAAWVGLLATDEPWPRKSAVLCCLAVGLLEPLGLVTLALKVLPNFSPYLGVLILGTTTALSIFVETLRLLRQPGSWVIKLTMLLATFFMLAGLAITAYIISDQVQDAGHQVEDIVHVVVGVVCLNIAWFPRLLSGTCQIYIPPEAHLDDRGSIIASASVTNTDATMTETANGQLNVQEMIELPCQAKPRHNVKKATWKASFIIYGVRTMATFLFSFIFFYIDSDFVSSNFDHASQSAFVAAWSFDQERLVDYTWTSFGVNLAGALICYLIAFIASHTNIQRGCLGIPFILSLSLTVLLTASYDVCSAFIDKDLICQTDSTKWYLVLGATVSLTLAQALSFGWNSFRKDKIYLRKEDKLFWIPGYNSAVLDSWLLLNSQHTTKHFRTPTGRSKSFKTRVYICTTMYREDEGEMRQLLESLAKINMAQVEGETFFESHVIFDGGVKQRKLSEFSLVLISILEETLGVQPFAATKVVTPYGMKLSWGLPTSRDKPQMTFNIHLKDNTLVKNKKRWSQIMYMSYVLDYLRNTYTLDEETYILTTDADVMFTPGSVEALLDLMTRDSTIGAVCARTHPMGSGPLVWYQIFEYAIGHWFQKATEHVLGSVMCAPGCFSVYRCRALRDILPKYCKKVESSLDFLTKDMGEDRWLCTLMVQSGWRIEYCAASENSTNCPSEFEEFFKQRRRWIASTLANLMLIIREWQYIALFNHQVSVVFLVYQALLLFSTLISPSTVILIVSGGLYYGWDVSPVTTVILQVILCVLFAMACILTAPETHLLMAKICTFLYAVVMCAVSVGIAVQIVMDLSEDSEKDAGNKTSTSTHKKPSQHISESIPVSITTVYPACLVSIFVLAGLLHTREITCLFHGICFFLCTPAAYLLLIIYSICNLTDSSWGTREAETSHSTGVQISWSESYKKLFYTIFFCFASKSTRHVDAETQTVARSISRLSSVAATTDTLQIFPAGDERQAVGDDLSIIDEQTQADFLDHQFELEIEDVPIPVDKWLHPNFRDQYTEIFRKHGYDSTLFLKGLREADLRRMGITKKGHVQFLIAEIAKLPAYEIEYQVPTNVQDWLQEIGLAEYCDNFYRNHIQTPKEMEILKRFDRKEIEKELGINKDGHVKRLLEAIQKLRDPSESQLKTIKMRQTIEDIPVNYLNEIDVAEYEFWNQLRKKCLEPDLKAFGIDAEVKVNLVELRNSWLLILAVANTLWLILITTLASKVDLNFLGSNPLGVVFMIIFGLVFLVQFLAMLVHRMATFCHFIARAPYTFNRPFLTTWSFKDKVNEFDDPADVTAHHQKRRLVDAALKKAARYKRTATTSKRRTNEKTPLLSTNESNHIEEER